MNNVSFLIPVMTMAILLISILVWGVRKSSKKVVEVAEFKQWNIFNQEIKSLGFTYLQASQIVSETYNVKITEKILNLDTMQEVLSLLAEKKKSSFSNWTWFFSECRELGLTSNDVRLILNVKALEEHIHSQEDAEAVLDNLKKNHRKSNFKNWTWFYGELKALGFSSSQVRKELGVTAVQDVVLTQRDAEETIDFFAQIAK